MTKMRNVSRNLEENLNQFYTDGITGSIVVKLAEYIAVPKGTIYNRVNQRKLPYVKIGRRVKFDKQGIDKIIDKRKILLR